MGLFNLKVDKKSQQFIWKVLDRLEEILKNTIFWRV